jgi:phage repressor protein C with HTH and peptisase S24 domain
MSVVTTHPARVSVLQLEMPGEASLNAGILLEDRIADRLYLRLRRDWSLIAETEAEVLSALEDDLAVKAKDMGAAGVLAYLQDTLSNLLRISPLRDTMVEDFEQALARLYREHVHARVSRFVTHLPRYSLAAAAGRFLENQEVREEGWEETPPNLRLTPEMFVARVVGHSMEPRIPDGSLCIFRTGVQGSRQGRLVLVERRGGAEESYTVKRYTSRKKQLASGEWEHERIRLEPLNQEFEAWDLDPEEGRFRIVAEFVQLLY